MNLQPGTRYCFRVRVAASSVAKPASPWSRPCDATTTDQGLRTVSDAESRPPQPEAALGIWQSKCLTVKKKYEKPYKVNVV